MVTNFLRLLKLPLKIQDGLRKDKISMGHARAIVNVPSGAQLYYDDRDIPALAEDQKDRAVIKQSQASQIKTLIDAGFEADSVLAAVTSSDYARLTHTGLFSVQLQPPGTGEAEPAEPADVSSNGSQPAMVED